MSLRDKYGEWGIVCGGSVGQGGAHSNRLASEGVNVCVVGRHLDTVEAKCKQLEADYGVQTRAIVQDLGDDDAAPKIIEATKDLEISILVYNAGLANVEEFKDMDIDYELYRLNCNVRTLLHLSLYYVKPMVERARGAIIITSSDGGVIGAPYVSTYSATKAYGMTLGEAMWGELRDKGVDVLAVLPGNTIGQNYSDIPPGTPGFQTGAEVVEEVYAHLGEYASWMSGEWNREALKEIYDADKRRATVLYYKQVMEENTELYGTGSRAER